MHAHQANQAHVNIGVLVHVNAAWTASACVVVCVDVLLPARCRRSRAGGVRS